MLRNVSLEFNWQIDSGAGSVESDKEGEKKNTRLVVCHVENRSTPDQSPRRVMRESITTGMKKRIMQNMTCAVYSPLPVFAN